MKTRFKLFSILLIVVLHSKADQKDSLKAELLLAKSDSSKVLILLEIAQIELKSNPDTFFYYSRRAYNLAQGNQFKKGLNRASSKVAYFFRHKGSYDSALYYYLISLEALEPGDTDVPQVLYDLGNVYRAMNQFEKAIVYYFESLKISEESKNMKGIALANLGLGSVHIDQKEIDKALVYFKNAQNGFKKIEDVRGAYIATNNIGTALHEAGRYSEAKQYFVEAERSATAVKDYRGMSDIYSNLGVILEREFKFDSAFIYHIRALTLRKKFALIQGVVKSYHNLASVNIQLRNFVRAEKYLDSAYSIAKDLDSNIELKYYWNYKVKLDTAKGQYKSATYSLFQYQKYKDIVEDDELKSQIAELQTKYETDKKDREILNLSQQAQIQALELSQRNTQLIGTAILVLVLVLGGVVINQRRTFRHKQAVADMEQRFLRLQMNPHFIFNALASIQTYILQSNTKESVSYLAKFGKLMRQILEHSREEFITLREEADMLRNYMEIQQLRFKDRFEFNIVIDPELDPEITRIPPLFAQPFVENAIEHGFREKRGEGKLTIKFQKAANGVSLEIQDNGLGFMEAGNEEKEHRSLATQITRERLALLSRRFKSAFSLDIDSKSDVGTSAKLLLPVEG